MADAGVRAAGEQSNARDWKYLTENLHQVTAALLPERVCLTYVGCVSQQLITQLRCLISNVSDFDARHS